jgi:Cu/Zn superoxide dismutase
MSKTLLYGATKVDETNVAYAAAASLEQFQWKNRVIVIFADTDNARAARQENQLLADPSALEERDVVLLKVVGGSVRLLFGVGGTLDAEAISRDLAHRDGPQAGDFAAVLVGKDGTVKLNVHEPVSSGELFAIIDAMPLRAAEGASSGKQRPDEGE